MKSKIKTALFRLTSIILIFIFLVFLINTPIFDSKLNSKITEILQKQAVAPTKGNAYYAIMGIKASSDKDIIKTSIQLFNRYKENRSSGSDELTEEDYDEILNVKQDIDKQWIEKFGKCQPKAGEDCLGEIIQILQTTKNKSPRLTLMQQRYDKIINMDTYANFNDITIGTPLPNYSYLFRLGNLKKAELYLLANKKEFLLQIQKEMKFFKMQLTQGEMILDHMIAHAAIRNNIKYLSNYIHDKNVPDNELSIIETMLKPLTSAELDISSGFISESRTLFKATNAAKSFSLDYILFQTNDSNNLLYKYFTEPNVTLSKMSSTEISKAIKDGYMDSIVEEKASLLGYNPSSLYNFSGKVMITSDFCDGCWNYIARVYDLNNIINLVKLQLELKNNNPSNIQQAILNSNISNNYTKKAFDYDAKHNSVYFNCLEEKSSDCSVKL